MLELDPHRRAVAEKLGLRTLDPSKQDIAVEIDAWTKGAGASVAFEVSGSAAGRSLRAAAAFATPGSVPAAIEAWHQSSLHAR